MISNVKQKVFHPLLSVSAAHNWRTFQVHSLFCARNSKNTIFTHHFLFWVFQLPQYASVPGWDTTWWNARSPEQTAGGSQISEDRYMMDAHIKDSVFHRHLADFYNLSQVCNRWSCLHGPDEYMLGGGGGWTDAIWTGRTGGVCYWRGSKKEEAWWTFMPGLAMDHLHERAVKMFVWHENVKSCQNIEKGKKGNKTLLANQGKCEVIKYLENEMLW